MSNRIRQSRVIAGLCGSFLLLTGCAETTAFGNSILEASGYGSLVTFTKTASGVSDALRDLTREEEYYLGRAVAARLLAQYREVNDPETIAYVQRVGLVVARHSERPVTYGGYHFSVLESDTLNAFAAPGGFIFVTTGLLQALPDEDTLASILSHEVAHVALRHGEKAISGKTMTDALLAVGKLAASAESAAVLDEATLLFGDAVEDVLGQLLENGYSREMEREADVAGLRALVASGYRPAAAIEALEVLRSRTETESGWFSSHPADADRIERLQSIQVKEGHTSEAGYAKRQKRFHYFVK